MGRNSGRGASRRYHRGNAGRGGDGSSPYCRCGRNHAGDEPSPPLWWYGQDAPLRTGASAQSRHFSLSTFLDLAYFAAMTLTEQMTQLAQQAKAASRELAKLTTAEKNACLLAMADALDRNGAAIKAANALDMETGAKMGLLRRDARPAQARRQTHRRHGQGAARSRRPAGPGRPDPGRTRPPQRPEAAESLHAHRRRGHHLRIASRT